MTVSTLEVSVTHHMCTCKTCKTRNQLTWQLEHPVQTAIVFRPGEEEGLCDYVSAITHTGAATRNGFVMCEVVE